ncbi:MAG: methylated-DNA--[protein]-cysteine S-methyltransferase [Halobacteria archaeon]
MARRLLVPLPALGCAAEAEVEGRRVLRIRLKRGRRASAPRNPEARALFRALERWVESGRAGSWRAAPRLTPFQRKVLGHVARIPRGETRTYGEVARALGTGPRAVGRALGANPVPLLIPCHRVVAAGGIGGFSGPGVGTKRRLLALEAPSRPSSLRPRRRPRSR